VRADMELASERSSALSLARTSETKAWAVLSGALLPCLLAVVLLRCLGCAPARRAQRSPPEGQEVVRDAPRAPERAEPALRRFGGVRQAGEASGARVELRPVPPESARQQEGRYRAPEASFISARTLWRAPVKLTGVDVCANISLSYAYWFTTPLPDNPAAFSCATATFCGRSISGRKRGRRTGRDKGEGRAGDPGEESFFYFPYEQRDGNDLAFKREKCAFR